MFLPLVYSVISEINSTENNPDKDISSGLTGEEIVTTIAGTGKGGYSSDDKPASKAELNGPCGITIDNEENIYISECGNSVIRKITKNGIITTIAGNRKPGFGGDSDKAIKAEIRPQKIAVDFNGNLYIADIYNNRIRKVSTDGIITTVAGNGAGEFSGDSRQATKASIFQPEAVAVDKNGNIFIADTRNHRIRKVDTSGIITTVAGNGKLEFEEDNIKATETAIGQPFGLDVDEDGNLYIADRANFRIYKIGEDGILKIVAGNGEYDYNGDDLPAIETAIRYPEDVKVDKFGNIYILDYGIARVRKVGKNGIMKIVVGDGEHGYNGDGEQAKKTRFKFAKAICVDNDGNLYIADTGNERIRKVTVEVSLEAKKTGNREDK